MPQRNQFSGKVELDVQKTKKAQINYETLRGPTTLFGLGIVKLGQLISKWHEWIGNLVSN